jgi:hypothetical protein
MPESPTPPSGKHGPQWPAVQDMPWQQSAVFEQVSLHFWHGVGVQMYGGIPPSTGFGTHGLPQQFALEAHDPPASTHGPEQRGTPTLS